MNKAFVREPEAVDERCPRCDCAGLRVTERTVTSFLTEDQIRRVSPATYFCPSPTCEVLYFNGFGQVIVTGELDQTFYPKDSAAPLCACFGLTCHEIERDVDEGVVTRTRAAVERAKTDEAMCAIKAPSGRSCVAEVQKYYMKCRNAASG